MRVAWLGPAPSDREGVSYVATQLLRGLADCGVEVDCFVTTASEELPQALRDHPRLTFVSEVPRWNSERWHARAPLFGFVTGQLARARAQVRLAGLAAERHTADSYDVLYQFSQIELGLLRRLRRELPPIVLHPEVHAAGELRWHRREADLARRAESRARHAAVRAMLTGRSVLQRRDMRLARRVVSPSRHFAAHLARDYGIPLERLGVVPNPIDLERFTPGEGEGRSERPGVKLLFVSRMAVRKGLEMVVELSHRIGDLAGRVEIELIGDRSLWSDYRPLLSDLNPATASYGGPAAPADLPRVYRSGDAILQPAHYEPFALTVGEALACGLPVVASDEVGAAEQVDAECCTLFPAGDVAAFERAVRALVATLEGEGRRGLPQRARREAERLFAPTTVASQLVHELELATR